MGARARRVADRALTVGAVLGALTLLATALGLALGVRPLFFRSGSMAPTIATGSMALARDVSAADLRVGDVVSVSTPAGVRVTHRVVAAQPAGHRVVLTLRGDANRTADPESYVVGSAYRVFWHVPWLGYAVATLKGPLGVLLGLGVAGLVLARRGRRDVGRAGRHAHRHPPRHRGRAAGAAAMTAVAVGAGPAAPASAAAWTDGVAIGGAQLTASSVPASASFDCGLLSAFSVAFAWTPVPGATSYTLHYGSGGSLTAAVSGTSATLVTAIAGGTAWVVANHDYGSVTWTSAASNTRTYTVAGLSFCA